MTRISYVNGEFVEHQKARVQIEDRGYQFSDGVYEVIYIKQGVAIDWDLHVERLKYSLNGLKISYHVDDNELYKLIEDLLAKNKLSDAALYLQITRGVANRDHAFPKVNVEPSLVMTISPFSSVDEAVYQQGASVITCRDLRWKRRDYKTISLLPNVLAKESAIESGAVEAILVEDDGFVTEGSATNIFIVDNNGVLVTHPPTERILGGITRLGVLKVAKDNSFKTIEEPFTLQDLSNAKEVFITSTTKHILPIVKVDGNVVADGKVGDLTKSLIELYKNYIDSQIS